MTNEIPMHQQVQIYRSQKAQQEEAPPKIETAMKRRILPEQETFSHGNEFNLDRYLNYKYGRQMA